MHRDLTAAFRAALDSGDLPDGLGTSENVEAVRRFAVYRNNVAYSLAEALAARFPVVERLVGSEFFRATAQIYLKAEPPKGPVLVEWGEGFAAFLETFPPVASLPYLPDMARVDFAVGRAYHAADTPPLTAVELVVTARVGDPRVGLHPSVHLVRSRWPIATIWQANQPGAPEMAIDGGRAESALIHRNPALDVEVIAISPGDAHLVEALPRSTLGRALDEAAEAVPGYDAAPFLARLAALNLLVSR